MNDANNELIDQIVNLRDEIIEDKFGNLYAHFILDNLKQGTKFKVSIKRKITSASYKKEIPITTNTEILEGFEMYLEPQEKIDSNYEDIILKAKELTQNKMSDYEKAKAIFEYINVNAITDLSIEYANKGSISALNTMRGTTEEFSTLFVAMCRAINIPSRVIEGYAVIDKSLINVVWSEIYLEEFGWVPVDPSIPYIVNNKRVSYFDAFCKINEGEYVAKGIYYYEKGDRRMKGVDEVKMECTFEQIKKN